jgi:hypothetical protein
VSGSTQDSTRRWEGGQGLACPGVEVVEGQAQWDPLSTGTMQLTLPVLKGELVS